MCKFGQKIGIYIDKIRCYNGSTKKMRDFMKGKFALLLSGVLALTALCACKKDDPSVYETRSGWLLSAPAYMGGTLSYNTGTGLDMHTARSAGELQLAYQTSQSEFEAYLDKVEKNGYTQIAKTQSGANIFAEYQKDGGILYAYYLDALKEVRVVEDSASVAETDAEFSYTVGENERTVIYQYALMNDPYARNDKSVSAYQDNGMFYIIRQANGKLILVDGGSRVQATDGAVDALLNFLYEITGKAQSEKIEVSALVLSHAHDDHKEMVHKLLQKYAEKITVERAIFNFPFWSADTATGESYAKLGALIKEKYPAIKYIKPHTGQSILLGEVTLDILLTHEDLLESKVAMTKAKNFNNTTTVIKYTVAGKSFLQLGDFSGTTEITTQFLNTYKVGNAYPALNCDIVQTAHHAMNDWLDDLYVAIGAKYAFVPTADCNFKAYTGIVNPCYASTIQHLIGANESVNLYFQNRNTYGLQIDKNGGISETVSTAIRGVNSDYLALLDGVQAFVK